MQEQVTTKLFYAGMRLDTDPRLLKEGEHGIAFNLRFGATQNGNKGARENVPSTVANNFTLPAEQSLNIGSYYYPKNNCSYDFYWNSEGFHFITEFNATSGVTTKLIQNITDTNGADVLQWTTKRFDHIRVLEVSVDGIAQNVLLWANDDIYPSKLNIEKAKASFYTYYTEAIIKLIKAPYLYPVIGSYQSDFTKQFNYLQSRPLPQLFIQYVYQDNELSVWSPISSIKEIENLPYRDEYFNVAGNSANIWVDNRVRYRFPIGTEDVRYIRIGYRETNTGNFFNITEIDPSEAITYKEAFQVTRINLDTSVVPQDTTYTVTVDDTDYDTAITDIANKNLFEIHQEIAVSLNSQLPAGFVATAYNEDNPFFSYVILERDVSFEFSSTTDEIRYISLSEAIDDNNYVFYFYNDGVYSAISNDAALQPYDAIPYKAGNLELTDNNVIILGKIQEGWDNVNIDADLTLTYEDYVLEKYSENSFSVSGTAPTYTLVFGTVDAGSLYVLRYVANNIQYTYSYRFETAMTNTEARYAIYCDLYLKVQQNQNLSLVGTTGSFSLVISGIEELPELVVYKDVKTQRTSKRGGAYQYGIVYENAEAISGGTNTNQKLNITIPFYNQSISLGLPKIGWAINSQPPEDAVAYKWVRSKNLLFDYFFQFFAGYAYLKDKQRFIDLNNLTYFQEKDNTTEAYTFTEGDRIRFIASPVKPGEMKASVSTPYTIEDFLLETDYPYRFNNEEVDPNKVFAFNKYTAKYSGPFKFRFFGFFISVVYFTPLGVGPWIEYILYYNKIRNGVLTKTVKYNYTCTGNTSTQIGGGPFTIDVDDADVEQGDIIYFSTEFVWQGPGLPNYNSSEFIVTFCEFEVFNLDESLVTDLSPMPTYIDTEIQSAEGLVLNLGEVPFVITSGTLFEIYRPKKLVETNRLRYYDISESFPIINPGASNRYHGGQIQNQDAVLPATGVFDGGDVWYKFSQLYQLGANQTNTANPSQDWLDSVSYSDESLIYYEGFLFVSQQNSNLNHVPLNTNGSINSDWWKKAQKVPVLRESLSFSDFAVSTDTGDLGRESVVVENSKKQWLSTAFRYGGSYVQGTLINGSNNFQLSQIRVYDDFNGASQRLNYVNRELTILFVNKVAKVLVNENIISSNRGEATIAASNQFLSDLIYMDGEYGIGDFPSSYQNTSFGEFFFDNIRGAFCVIEGKSVQDLGLVAGISTYGFNQALLSRVSGSKIISGLNIRDGEYLLTFLPQGEDASTIAIDYKSKVSGTFYDFTPHGYGRTGIYLRSFKPVGDTIAWTHSNESIKNTFYGTFYPSTVMVPINEGPKTKKIFEHFKINANSRWHLPTITIPADESYPTGMLSRVKPNNIGLYEGTYWAQFLRDINTPSQASEIENLFKGRKLRGDYMEITLQNDSTSLAILFSMDVFFALSQQTS